MNVYKLSITLHDYLFFASREIGYLWETIPVIHNYALTYSLRLCDSTYHFPNPQVPKYSEHLSQVNVKEIYVTPAQLNLAQSGSQLSDTQFWKYEFNGENYSQKMASREYIRYNLPLVGRNKVIHPEVNFTSYLICRNKLPGLDRWIRLGKWETKAEVAATKLRYKAERGDFNTIVYLNPLDLHKSTKVKSFDVLNMPPCSLVKNLTAYGEYLVLEDGVHLPDKLSYRILEVV